MKKNFACVYMIISFFFAFEAKLQVLKFEFCQIK